MITQWRFKSTYARRLAGTATRALVPGLDGTPPKRLVVLAFDSMDKAKAWHASEGMKQVDDIRMSSTNSRQFIADGKVE